MERGQYNGHTISPADFLYYDPYYLALRERSKAYPPMPDTAKHRNPARRLSLENPSINPVTRTPPDRHEVVTCIVSNLSDLLETELFTEERLLSPLSRKLISSLPGPLSYSNPETKELIESTTNRALAIDPDFGSQVRELGQLVASRDRQISELQDALEMPAVKSPSHDIIARELQQTQIELENAKSQLLANTRVINALYADIDKYKNEIDRLKSRRSSATEKVSLTPTRDEEADLTSRYNDLKIKYDAAMQIIDRMNWNQF